MVYIYSDGTVDEDKNTVTLLQRTYVHFTKLKYFYFFKDIYVFKRVCERKHELGVGKKGGSGGVEGEGQARLHGDTEP